VTPEQIAQVGDDADQALQKGDLERAFNLYSQLGDREPKNARWPGGMALVLRKLGRKNDEIEALARVARIHVEGGETLRAISTLKHVLTLAPDHPGARRALTALSARISQPSIRIASVIQRNGVDSQPAGPLDRMPLHQMVPEARAHLGKPSVHRIPLGGEDESVELHLGGAVPRRKAPSEDFSLEEALVADVAAEVRTAERAQALVPKVELFHALDAESLDTLVLAATLVSKSQGEEVFHQGEKADSLYIVSDGLIGVVDEGPPRRGVAKLGPGNVFGEISIITDQPRTATAIALRPTELIAIDRNVIRRLIHQNSNVLVTMLGFVRDRMINRLIAIHPLFSVLSPDDAHRIKARLHFLEIETGGVFIEAGAPVSALFVMLAGRADVVERDQVIATLESGDIAGELSLLRGQPATASVRAATRCWVIAMSAADFATIIQSRPEARTWVEEEIAARTAENKLRWHA